LQEDGCGWCNSGKRGDHQMRTGEEEEEEEESE